MKTQPTFTATAHRGNATSLICRETGERYSIGQDCHGRFVAYREGRVICLRASRDGALAAIESDARWAIREQHQDRLDHAAPSRLIFG